MLLSDTISSSLVLTVLLHYCVSTFALSSIFFFNDTATTEIYTLSLHDALPILPGTRWPPCSRKTASRSSRCAAPPSARSEEHTSELQSHSDLVCRLLLEKKKKKKKRKKKKNQTIK